MLAGLVATGISAAPPAAAAFAPELWTQLSPAASPSARSAASAAYDPATGQTILFGGAAGATPENDTWNWTGTTWA
jgi:hypothetical protein